MNLDEANQFAREWIEAWNSHDLDRILSHYTDDFEMNSPLIVEFMNEPSGRLNGKSAVRVYWDGALQRNPDLRFELIEVFAGVDSIVIHYENQNRRKGAEAFFFDEGGLVHRCVAHYRPGRVWVRFSPCRSGPTGGNQ